MDHFWNLFIKAIMTKNKYGFLNNQVGKFHIRIKKVYLKSSDNL